MELPDANAGWLFAGSAMLAAVTVIVACIRRLRSDSISHRRKKRLGVLAALTLLFILLEIRALVASQCDDYYWGAWAIALFLYHLTAIRQQDTDKSGE